jgi:UDP-N-acetylglucosamine--N-acetylmuramyl-(pentapeptide) pyrophosphoryl-undecaprenol N-acetylglucosamine transferase
VGENKTMTSSPLRVLLTGGGSGGHVYPLLAVHEALKKDRDDIEFFYLGPQDAFSQALKDAGIKVSFISGAKLRRYASLENILDFFRFWIGLLEAWWKLFWIMPDTVFSKGGTGAFPVVCAAWFYRIPVVIHESDAQPGLTNLLSSWFASRILTSFASANRYFDPKKTLLVGNPVRAVLLQERTTPEVAKQELGFSPALPLMLVMGGSQGSQRINEFIMVNLQAIIKDTQVLHVTGAAQYADVQKLTRAALFETAVADAEHRYKAVPYLQGGDLRNALTAADLIVGRAGSGAIFEGAAFGKPMILIPHAASNQHQHANAYEIARAGGAIVIEENNLLLGIFAAQAGLLLRNQAEWQKMSDAARAFGKPNAAELVSQEITKFLQ